jgi:hypothetical protein
MVARSAADRSRVRIKVIPSSTGWLWSDSSPFGRFAKGTAHAGKEVSLKPRLQAPAASAGNVRARIRQSTPTTCPSDSGIQTFSPLSGSLDTTR